MPASTFTPVDLDLSALPFDPVEMAVEIRCGAIEVAAGILGDMIREHPLFLMVLVIAAIVGFKSILRGILRMVLRSALD